MPVAKAIQPCSFWVTPFLSNRRAFTITSIQMKACCAYTRVILAAALALPGTLPVLSQVINEIVPPASDHYPLGPDSQIHSSVAAGKTFTFNLED